MEMLRAHELESCTQTDLGFRLIATRQAKDK